MKTVEQVVEAIDSEIKQWSEPPEYSVPVMPLREVATVSIILRQWAEGIAEEIYSKIEAAEWPYMVDKQPVKDIIAQL